MIYCSGGATRKAILSFPLLPYDIIKCNFTKLDLKEQLFCTLRTSWMDEDKFNMDTNVSGCDEYEIRESCTLFYLIFWGIIGMIIFIVGITGNIFSLLIVNRIGQKSVTLFLLKSLAIVETLLLLIFVFQFSITSFLDHFHYSNVTSSVYLYIRVYFGFPFFLACLSTSAWITCLLAFHRYVFSVCFI